MAERVQVKDSLVVGMLVASFMGLIYVLLEIVPSRLFGITLALYVKAVILFVLFIIGFVSALERDIMKVR